MSYRLVLIQAILMSTFQAIKSRRDDITIEKLIKNCGNPEGVIVGFVYIKFFRSRKAWFCDNYIYTIANLLVVNKNDLPNF